MPLGFWSPEFASYYRRRLVVVLLCLVLLRLGLATGGAAAVSRLIKLGAGPDLPDLVASASICSHHGGGAVREVVLMPGSRSVLMGSSVLALPHGARQLPMVCSDELLRWEVDVGVAFGGAFSNKCGYVCGARPGDGARSLCSTGRGDEGVESSGAYGCRRAGLQGGWSAASFGSVLSAAALFLPSNPTVERRLLPARSLVSSALILHSACRRRFFFNLQAMLPSGRPFSFSIVCSRCPIPSGYVPRDGTVDCAVKLLI